MTSVTSVLFGAHRYVRLPGCAFWIRCASTPDVMSASTAPSALTTINMPAEIGVVNLALRRQSAEGAMSAEQFARHVHRTSLGREQLVAHVHNFPYLRPDLPADAPVSPLSFERETATVSPGPKLANGEPPGTGLPKLPQISWLSWRVWRVPPIYMGLGFGLQIQFQS